MIFMRILPGVLKELSKYVPSVLFQAVDWNELAHEIPKLTRRMIQKEGLTDLLLSHRARFESHGITPTIDSVFPTPMLDDEINARRILTFFFGQIFLKEGFFLDLRPNHFEGGDAKLRFHISGFWTTFAPEFRESLLKVYDGFYGDDQELYLSGLEGIGLIKSNWSPEDKANLAQIFSKQFGDKKAGAMKFQLEQLNKTIIELSHFMLERRVKISKDFLYLGIYLVTLYATLEETNVSLPVKEIYLEARKSFNKA